MLSKHKEIAKGMQKRLKIFACGGLDQQNIMKTLIFDFAQSFFMFAFHHITKHGLIAW